MVFGDILADDEKGIVVGNTICERLEAAGFHVEWDSSIKTRILVSPLHWQRRLSA